MNIKKLSFALVLLLMLSGIVNAQYSWSYFGRSKEMLKAFDWKQQETTHFVIHHYSDDAEFIKKIAQTAEQAYTDLSLFLDVEVEQKIPIIFYTSHIDFEQTNLIDYMPPGVEAFAEPIGHRMVLHGDRNFSEFARTLVHELGHIFYFQIVYKNISRSNLTFNRTPLWVAEGFSELITNNWDSFNLLTIRDAVLYERLPAIAENGDISASMLLGRIDYDMGHLVYEFIMQRYGRTGVRKMLYAFRSGHQPFRSLDTTAKDFNFELRKYAREKFKPYKMKENPEEYSAFVGPDIPFLFSFSHQLSPSGEMAAVLTFNLAQRKMDLILISMKTGKMVRSLTPGVTMKHDGMDVKFNPADGNSFAWDNKGEQICYFARRSLVNYLVFNDVYQPKKIRLVPLPGIGSTTSPFFHPQTGELYFIGVEKSRGNLYRYNMKTDKIERLTDGEHFIKSANISKDGATLVYSVNVKEHINLFTAPLSQPAQMTAITAGPNDDINPIFDLRGEIVYFSSDRDGAFNIYALDLKAQNIKRFTNVSTGNFFPLIIPDDPDHLLVSSFLQGAFQLFKLDITKPQSDQPYQRELGTEITANEEKGKEIYAIPSFLDQLSSTFNLQAQGKANQLKVAPTLSEPEKYKPFKNLSISSMPGFGLGYATDGSIMAYTSLSLEDLMMDYTFNLLIYRIYGYQSYQLSYMNQKNRLKLYTNFFYFNDAYQLSYSPDITNYESLRKRIGGSAGFIYPLSREYRLEAGLSLYYQEESSDNLMGEDYPFSQYFDGPAAPVSLSFVADAAGYSQQVMGPLMGHSFKLNLTQFIPASAKFLSATNVDLDLRKYFRISNSALLATRLYAFTSLGENPQLRWMGGNNTIRSLGFYQLTGTSGAMLSAELRLPIISQASTPLGIIGPIRGVIFADVGGAWYKGQPYDFFEPKTLRLKDGFGSYGFGFTGNILGYPLHFEWVWQMDNQLRDPLYPDKKTNFNFWIGFDF